MIVAPPDRVLPAEALGRGITVVTATDGSAVAVINVMGSLSLGPARSMWELIDGLVGGHHLDRCRALVRVHPDDDAF
mgnify:CR=1 FL=1